MPYVARRPLTVHGHQVGIGEEVDMSLLPRPESIIRSGKVIWVGDGPRDKIVPEEFTKPQAKAQPARKGLNPDLVVMDEIQDFPAPAKKAATKTVAKKTTPKAPAKKAAAT